MVRPQPAEIENCLDVLARLQALEPDDPDYVAVERAAAHLRKSGQKKRRAARRRAAAAHDLALREQSLGFADAPAPSAPPATPGPGLLRRERRCYVCKRAYRAVDGIYHLLCPECADLNRGRRQARADLRGRRALLTGGRIKIGFETGLKLLRDGAQVLVTSRFPRDAARRYAAQPDFAGWRQRLRIVGLDLRRLPDVLAFSDQLWAAGEPLDILINNAAQTVRRPPAYYAQLCAAEDRPLEAPLAELVSPAAGAASLAVAGPAPEFPLGLVDESGQPLDLRADNSWTQRLAEVDPLELVEVQVVNVIAPFLLVSRLQPLLCASPFADRYVVNVSAVEGQFQRSFKTPRHPHTNMAKAALNMLTRTSAQDLATHGISMCSVDTGWVTDENPHPLKTRLRAGGFRPPLDVIDGAARVYDPIVRGVAGAPVWGCFLKDYQRAPW